MCKTNVKTYVYYVNMCKHEHKKNMIRVWCKIVPKTNVEQIEENGGFTSIITFWGFSSKKFPRKFLCVHRINKLFENFHN